MPAVLTPKRAAMELTVSPATTRYVVGLGAGAGATLRAATVLAGTFAGALAEVGVLTAAFDAGLAAVFAGAFAGAGVAGTAVAVLAGRLTAGAADAAPDAGCSTAAGRPTAAAGLPPSDATRALTPAEAANRAADTAAEMTSSRAAGFPASGPCRPRAGSASLCWPGVSGGSGVSCWFMADPCSMRRRKSGCAADGDAQTQEALGPMGAEARHMGRMTAIHEWCTLANVPAPA